MATMRCSVAARAAVRPSRAAVVVRASAEQSTKRQMLGLLAGAVASALLAPQAAEAIRIPSQEFTGGLVQGGGNSPKSPSGASMESYNMEGTKKNGSSLKKRRSLMAKVRAQGEKGASS